MASAVLIALVVAVVAAQSPCGPTVATVLPPKTPKILATWNWTGSNLELTCGYASFADSTKAMVPLGVICGATNSGPYFTFPVTPFVDFFKAATNFPCPFRDATFSVVGYNRYDSSVTVTSAATGIVRGVKGAAAPPSVSFTSPSAPLAVQPLVCGGNMSMTLAGRSSKAVLYMPRPGTSSSLTCFGIYSNVPSDLEVAYACAEDAAFSKNVVPLMVLPQWYTGSIYVECPFNGYFGIVVANRAATPVTVGYYARADVNSKMMEPRSL